MNLNKKLANDISRSFKVKAVAIGDGHAASVQGGTRPKNGPKMVTRAQLNKTMTLA